MSERASTVDYQIARIIQKEHQDGEIFDYDVFWFSLVITGWI